MDIAGQALLTLLEPARLVFLVGGVLMGLAIGLLPGLSGIVGMAILLPFTYALDPATGLAMLIGVAAVSNTSDTFPSVLLGIPGSSGSQATVMDGYPLAQQGQAARALSAAFIASLVGGIIGAIVLSIIVPFARPIILAFGSPELFMLTLFGLSMVGVLSGKKPLLGLTAAVLGLLLGTVGAAPVAAAYRYDFGLTYLFDGFPLVVVALGLFAIPEVVDLLVRGGSIARDDQGESLGTGWWQGIRDAITHRWLIVRHSLVGVFVGFIPGLGSAIVDWINYGLVVQLSRDRSRFGHGDIRGVIAPESANNAKEGGALIPTILFGIPGSAGMAIILGALIIQGIQPGPALVERHLDLLWVIIWSLALANVIGTGISLILSRPIARLTRVRFSLIVPFIIVMVLLAGYQETRSWGDLITLLAFGGLGWLMKRHRMPRPPLLIGFILSTLAERYWFISTMRYGYGWLTHTGVLVILSMTVLFVVVSIARNRRQRATDSSHGR